MNVHLACIVSTCRAWRIVHYRDVMPCMNTRPCVQGVDNNTFDFNFLSMSRLLCSYCTFTVLANSAEPNQGVQACTQEIFAQTALPSAWVFCSNTLYYHLLQTGTSMSAFGCYQLFVRNSAQPCGLRCWWIWARGARLSSVHVCPGMVAEKYGQTHTTLF